MATPRTLEFDFLPESYRASLESRRRAVIFIGGILLIVAVGGIGIARQVVVLTQLLHLRHSLRTGLPGLEKAVREEQELAAQLARATEKAESVAPILGGLPLHWLFFNLLKSVPENTMLERLAVELEEIQTTNDTSGLSTAPSEVGSDQDQARLKQLLRGLDEATLKVTVSGQALRMQEIQTFLKNLRGTNLVQSLELERIEEVPVPGRNPVLRFDLVGRMPYQVYRLPGAPLTPRAVAGKASEATNRAHTIDALKGE